MDYYYSLGLDTVKLCLVNSGGRRYFRLGGLNDESVRSHVGSRGVWEHFPLENLSQFKALRLLLRTVVQHAVLSVVLYFATCPCW